MRNSNGVTGATDILITQNTLNYFKQPLHIYHKIRRTNLLHRNENWCILKCLNQCKIDK